MLLFVSTEQGVPEAGNVGREVGNGGGVYHICMCIYIYIEDSIGFFRDNGKENGNYGYRCFF